MNTWKFNFFKITSTRTNILLETCCSWAGQLSSIYWHNHGSQRVPTKKSSGVRSRLRRGHEMSPRRVINFPEKISFITAKDLLDVWYVTPSCWNLLIIQKPIEILILASNNSRIINKAKIYILATYTATRSTLID